MRREKRLLRRDPDSGLRLPGRREQDEKGEDDKKSVEKIYEYARPPAIRLLYRSLSINLLQRCFKHEKKELKENPGQMLG